VLTDRLKPTLWPEVFGAHELFHLFVIAGSLAHYWFILTIVVPFRLGSGEVSCAMGRIEEDAASNTTSTGRV
jgi:hemolysin III